MFKLGEKVAKVSVENIIRANLKLQDIVIETPLQYNQNLSEQFEASIYLKREDLQIVRSYKIRGAYTFLANLGKEESSKGVVCASAGNHAQGFAQSCKLLGMQGHIFMPTTTPKQKVRQVERRGRDFVKVVLKGDTFDAASTYAQAFCNEQGSVFVPPFDHPLIIAGQGTVGVEILNQFKNGNIDFVFMPVGGGGLSAGVGTYLKNMSPETRLIGVEPLGAPAMFESFKHNEIVALEEIDTFVDGAAVKRVGDHTFPICKEVLEEISLVSEGQICTSILQVYDQDAIVAEPAGVMSISVLDSFKEEIKGKNVVCVISGGNNDIQRMPEIKERSLMYQGLKHYFIINLPQRPGALREFLDDGLGPDDDITYFEYRKKTNRASGPVLVGIELKKKEDYKGLIRRMDALGFDYTSINDKPHLFGFLIS